MYLIFDNSLLYEGLGHVPILHSWCEFGPVSSSSEELWVYWPGEEVSLAKRHLWRVNVTNVQEWAATQP